MNVSTKKSTKKYAEFWLYGGKDVHLQPKIVINNNNSTEMKRIILSVLAIGLSMGVMAQKKSDAEISLASKKINVQPPKSPDIYTQFDESCATIDSINFFQASYQGQFAGMCTGQNLYGDTKYAEVYNFGQNVQIFGIATIIANMVETPIEQNIPIQLMSADFSSVLAEGSVEATDLVEDFTTSLLSTPMPKAEVATIILTLFVMKSSWLAILSSAFILPLKGKALKPSRVNLSASCFVRLVRETYIMVGQFASAINERSFKYLSSSVSV